MGYGFRRDATGLGGISWWDHPLSRWPECLSMWSHGLSSAQPHCLPLARLVASHSIATPLATICTASGTRLLFLLFKSASSPLPTCVQSHSAYSVLSFVFAAQFPRFEIPRCMRKILSLLTHLTSLTRFQPRWALTQLAQLPLSSHYLFFYPCKHTSTTQAARAKQHTTPPILGTTLTPFC
jgi:hypothetical protein